MSYSLRTKCFECVKNGEKNDKCVDEGVLKDAISIIHHIGVDRGHLGSGYIELGCSNFEQKERMGKSE